MNRTVLLVGFFISAAILGVLFLGLGRNPQKIESPLVGRTAPSFALREVGTGQTLGLEQYRGKPIVLNFWATWCGPCWEEHPLLVATARNYGADVQFLGVVFQDSEEKIMKFLRERGSAYPTVVDEAGKTAIAYGVGGIPETFFLNAAGEIVAKYDGPMTREAMSANLAKAMGR